MKSVRIAVALLFVALFSVPLAAQINDTYVIPVVGNASGANGTRWSTEFHLFNPQLQHPLKVSLVFLPTDIRIESKEVLVTVDPNMTGYAENIVGGFFEMSGTGALLVATFPEDNPGVPDRVLDRSFIVNTKTFNNASSGTFGQGVEGTWVGLLDTETDGITAVASGIRNFGTGTQGFRTNIGAVNLGRGNARIRVNVYDDTGRTVAQNLPFDIFGYGHFQDRLPATVDHGSVEFFVEDPLAGTDDYALIFPYASVVDNRSGDAVYIRPVLLASSSILYTQKALTQTLGKKITSDDVRHIRQRATRVAEVEFTAAGTVVRKIE